MKHTWKSIHLHTLMILLVCCVLVGPSVSAITKNVESLPSYEVQLINNIPPNPPEIVGPSEGQIKKSLSYEITLTDSDDDILLNLEIDWGDGTEEYDCGCGQSWRNGTVLYISHTWREKGEFFISARIQDSYGAWSNWSEPFPLTIAKQKNLSMTHQFLTRLFQPFQQIKAIPFLR